MRMVQVKMEEHPYLEANESFFDSWRMLSMLMKAQMEENKAHLKSSEASSNFWSIQALILYVKANVWSLISKMKNGNEKMKNVVPIQSSCAINKPHEDLEWWKHLPQSAPIPIPPRKIKPLWVENTGWIKYQTMYR